MKRVADVEHFGRLHAAQDGDDAAFICRVFELHQMIPACLAMMASPFTMACGSP